MSERLLIDRTEVSVRTQNCLANEGFTYWDEVAGRSDDQLLEVPNLGRKSLSEVRAILTDPNRYAIPEPTIGETKPTEGMRDWRVYFSERNLDIFQRHENGATLESLGEEYRLSKERVRSIHAKCLRYARRSYSPAQRAVAFAFSCRQKVALHSAGIRTAGDFLSAYERGALNQVRSISERTLHRIESSMLGTSSPIEKIRQDAPETLLFPEMNP